MSNLNDFIQKYFRNQILTSPGVYCRCVMTTIQADGIVSYGFGILDYAPGFAPPGSYQGELRQYFSDRRYPQGGGPFDPVNNDSIRVQMGLGPENHIRVTLTLLNWGNAQATVHVNGYDASVLYGLNTGAAGNSPPNQVCAFYFSDPTNVRP